MSKPTSAVKRKYNKSAYRRYEVSVGLDTKLNYLLEEYKENGGNVSELIKTTLAKHFEIEVNEQFFPYHYVNGELVQTHFLHK